MTNGQISPDPIKVLCVEDEEFISELYERALKREGYLVKVVKSGADGLELARTNEYDIMLLDIMVPDILGIEVLKRLRHEVPDLKTKIIITTNLEQSDEVREDIERQADGYLIKAEITPKQLVEFLNHLKTD
ncbi:MAG TPA: response regulator [Candidatus Saccharimonadales bacterium]|nr:response regulator [Candidatus Saccharimonadales bacterium]